MLYNTIERAYCERIKSNQKYNCSGTNECKTNKRTNKLIPGLTNMYVFNQFKFNKFTC